MIRKGGLSELYSNVSNLEDCINNLPAMLRIRNKSFGSGLGSGLKLVSDSDPDSNPDLNPGFGSKSETGQNFFFCSKIFYPASSSKIKRLPSLSSMTWLRTRCVINLQDSD
jgi:hypothetical protein